MTPGWKSSTVFAAKTAFYQARLTRNTSTRHLIPSSRQLDNFIPKKQISINNSPQASWLCHPWSLRSEEPLETILRTNKEVKYDIKLDKVKDPYLGNDVIFLLTLSLYKIHVPPLAIRRAYVLVGSFFPKKAGKIAVLGHSRD